MKRKTGSGTELHDFLVSNIIPMSQISRSLTDTEMSSPTLILLLQQLQISLQHPEDVIVQQGDTGKDLFFLTKGEALVEVKDYKRKEYYVRNLEPGHHFGEVSIVHNCPRTASVISANYSTFAKLRYKKLMALSH
jgi:CRP-like cAMP-binding protein